MAEEKTSIFRPKTVESVQSPEVLDDYLRVTSPGVWVFLGAVICLLIGVLIWGVFGTIQTTQEVVVISEAGLNYCVVPYAGSDAVLAAGAVSIDEKYYTLDTYNYYQAILEEADDARIFILGGMKPGDYVVVVPLLEKVEHEGFYSGVVVTETLRPISLLLS